MADLESPDEPDALYRYRAPGIPWSRPITQGDVFEGIEIPGLGDGPGLAMVLTHACSMRQGPTLRPQVVVGRVRARDQAIALPWKGHFALLPLPGLRPEQPAQHHVVAFDELGTVTTSKLGLDARIACLDDLGIALLNQRHAHHFTRHAVEVAVLHEQSANVLAEVELLEDWIEAWVPDGVHDWDALAQQQSTEFDTFIGPLREDLKQPARRAAVRRLVHEEIRYRSP